MTAERSGERQERAQEDRLGEGRAKSGWAGRLRPGIAARISLAALPVIVVATLAMAGLIGVFGNRLVDRLAAEQGQALAVAELRHLQHGVEARLALVEGLARLVRVEHASGAPSRSRVAAWMRDTAEGGPTRSGLWFAAEPDALGADRAYRGDPVLGGGPEGRFQPYLVQDGAHVRFAELPPETVRTAGTVATAAGGRTFTGGADRRLVTIAVPVLHDGRLLGVAGAEFDPGAPVPGPVSVQPPAGRTMAIGPDGHWLDHPDPDLIGTRAEPGDPQVALTEGQMAAIVARRADISDVEVGGTPLRRYIMPFAAGPNGGEILMVADIPLGVLNLPLRELRYGIAAIALAFCVLLFLLLLALLRRGIGRPLRRLRRAVEMLEQGGADIALEERRRRDEVGGIARAIDRLRTSLSEQRLLRRDLDRMVGAVDRAGDGVLLVDRDGIVLYANPAMAKLAGVAPDMLKRGADHRALTAPDSARRRMEPGMPGAALARGENWQGVLEDWEMFGGHVVEAVALSMTVLPGGDVLYVARDVSQARRAAREREQLQAQLLHQDRLDALGRLTGGIAHEFNNMLAAMLGYAELLRADLDGASPQHGFASRIEQTALRARDLVGRLVTFARDDMVEDVTIDLGSALRDALPVLRVTVRAGIALGLEVEGERLPVRGNDGQLVQMLMNLCLNARDAIEEARPVGLPGTGPAAPGRIAIRAAPDRHWHARLLADGVAGWPETRIGEPEAGRDYLVLSVRDNGGGIAPAEFGRIFDPFYTTKARGKGSGLGLATVFGILRSWHGHVRLRSALGEGTQIELCIPVDRNPPQGDAPATEAPDVALRDPARRHILLVDDEVDLAEVTRRALARRGHEVTIATDPLRALAILNSGGGGDIDLLISDRNMPHLFGEELVRQARELHPDLCCILCTGHAEAVDPAAVRAAGIAAVFRKPVRAAELADWIDLHSPAPGNGRHAGGAGRDGSQPSVPAASISPVGA